MITHRPPGLGIVFAGAIALASLGAAPAAQTLPKPQDSKPAASIAAQGLVYPGVSRPSDKRDLAFAIRGTIADLHVKPGDSVKKGDQIMRLDDVVQRQTVELARLQADDDSPIRTARSTLAFREESLRRTREAAQKSGANESDLRQAEYDRDVAAIKVESTQRESQGAKLALEREKARLDQMLIESPIDGQVLDVAKRPGEAVDELTSVVTLVSVDPLWVEVNVPTGESLPLRVGQKAVVEWEDVDGRAAMTGRIIFKSPAGNGGARQVPVRIEVPNPDGLPSGMHGKVRFVEEP